MPNKGIEFLSRNIFTESTSENAQSFVKFVEDVFWNYFVTDKGGTIVNLPTFWFSKETDGFSSR